MLPLAPCSPCPPCKQGDCADLAPAVFRLAWLILLIWMAMLFLLLLLLFVCCDCCCTGRLRFVVVLQDPSEQQQQQQQRAPDPPPNSYQQSHSKYYCGASPDDLDRLRRDGDAFDRVASWSAQPGAQAPPAGVTSSSSSYRAASCTNVSVAQPLCASASYAYSGGSGGCAATTQHTQSCSYTQRRGSRPPQKLARDGQGPGGGPMCCSPAAPRLLSRRFPVLFWASQVPTIVRCAERAVHAEVILRERGGVQPQSLISPAEGLGLDRQTRAHVMVSLPAGGRRQRDTQARWTQRVVRRDGRREV